MIRVNLLPESYIRSLEQKRLRRHLVIIGFAAAVIAAGWWRLAWRQVDAIDRRVAVAAQNLSFEQAGGVALAQTEAQCKKLQAAKAVAGQLQEPLHPTIILSLLSKLIPDRVALTKLSVEMVPVREPKTVVKQEGVPQPTAPLPEMPIRLSIAGIAKSDGDVARCLNRLSEHPLFINVKLAKSQLALDGGPHRVAFEIMLEIPVQRRFVIANEEGPGHESL